MCQSIAKGGNRCSAHTRPAYLESLNNYIGKPGNTRTSGDYNDLFMNTRAFASTRKGQKEIQQDILAAEERKDSDTASILKDGLNYGRIILDKQEAIKKAVKKALDTVTIDKSLRDAIAQVQVAVALGFPAPTFVGSKYYSVYINDLGTGEGDEESQEFLGNYAAKELAEKALISYVKEQFNPQFPIGQQLLGKDFEIYWAARGPDGWIPGEKALDEETIYNYFTTWSHMGYLIKEHKIIGELKKESNYERSNLTIPDRSEFTYPHRSR